MPSTPKRSISRAISETFGDLDAALESVVHVVLHQHGRSGLRRGFHDLLQTHPHETHAVFERSAVLVAAAVGVGRKELRNQVSVPGVYLHRVESRVVGRMDGPPEVAGHLLDLAGPHAADRRVGVEVETRGRADRNLPRGGQVGHVAAVADLNSRRRAFAVHGVGDVTQPRHDFGPQPQLLVERKPAAADRRIGQRSHAHAAAGHRYVVILQLLRRAEMAAHRLERRRTDRAVAQRYGS